MVKFYSDDLGNKELELWTAWVTLPEKGEVVHLESGDYKVRERIISQGLVQIFVIEW